MEPVEKWVSYNPYLFCYELHMSTAFDGQKFEATLNIAAEAMEQHPEYEEMAWHRLAKGLDKKIKQYAFDKAEKETQTLKFSKGILTVPKEVDEEYAEVIKKHLIQWQDSNGNVIPNSTLFRESDTYYKDHATSEFEGVEGLDESLWNGGSDLA